jgi:hypothetical protein
MTQLPPARNFASSPCCSRGSAAATRYSPRGGRRRRSRSEGQCIEASIRLLGTLGATSPATAPSRPSVSWRASTSARVAKLSSHNAGRAGTEESNRHLGFRALTRTSARIAAYRRISARIADRGCSPRRCETPASCHFRDAQISETGLIAMQKVVGSNPISRFTSIPLHFGRLAFAGENETTPAYRLHFGH